MSGALPIGPADAAPAAGEPVAVRPMLSVIVPMFNEEENVRSTVDRIAAVLKGGFHDGPWEIILVNDGSVDETWEVARRLAMDPEYPWLRVKGYAHNRGRGCALRTGFAAARGLWVVATDADLSYEPDYILELVTVLREREDIDVVLASAYMPGGGVQGVSFDRLFVSRAANVILSWFMSPGNQKLHTITCVFRAYRRQVLDHLDLESDGKDIHLEILSKALMLGYRVTEVPVILRGRSKGRSKHKVRATAASHLIFALFERPILIFGLLGVLMLLGGFYALGIIVWDYLHGNLNPNRPLIPLMVLAFLGGLQIISFGIIGTQFVNLRKEIIRIQARLRDLLDRDER